jgi:DNA excision repair protein ERCC-4
MIIPTKPILYIDTREQLPLFSKRHHDRFHCIAQKTMSAGDYTYDGAEGIVAFERKSIQDLVGTLTKGRDRFERELEKARYYQYFAVVIEDRYETVSTSYSFSKMNPASVLGSLQAFQLRYGIDIIFAGNRRYAEDFIVAKIEGFFYAD